MSLPNTRDYESWLEFCEADLMDEYAILLHPEQSNPANWDKATMSEFLDWCYDRWVNMAPEYDWREDR